MFGAVFLSACTQNASMPDNSDASQKTVPEQAQSSNSKDISDDEMELDSSLPPKPTVPANLDQQTQEDLKELDKTMEEFDTDDYKTSDLSDLE